MIYGQCIGYKSYISLSSASKSRGMENVHSIFACRNINKKYSKLMKRVLPGLVYIEINIV